MFADIKQGLGEAIRLRRIECGLSKQKLGLMVGVNRLTIRKIENGTANPTLGVMLRIAEGLELPLSELVARGEEAAGV